MYSLAVIWHLLNINNLFFFFFFKVWAAHFDKKKWTGGKKDQYFSDKPLLCYKTIYYLLELNDKEPNSFLLQASKLKKKVKSLKGLKLGYIKSTD